MYGDSRPGGDITPPSDRANGAREDNPPHRNVVAGIRGEANCATPLLFHVGDFVYRGHDDSDRAEGDWEDFLNYERELINSGRLYAIVGNHENSAGISQYLGSIWDYIQDQMANLGKYDRSITNNLHFIAINSYGRDDRGGCDAQLQFLRSKLNSIPNKDVIVGMHHPIYPQIGDAAHWWSECLELHNVVKDHRDRGNKVLVISGHTHGLYLTKKDGIPYAGVGAATGIGGCSRNYQNESFNGLEELHCPREPGYMRCDVNLNCEFKDVNGVRTYGFQA